MGHENITLREINKRKTAHDFTHMRTLLKKKKKNPNRKQQTNKRKKTHRHREQIRGC